MNWPLNEVIKTVGGYDAEIFAIRDGYLYGAVESPGGVPSPVRWSKAGRERYGDVCRSVYDLIEPKRKLYLVWGPLDVVSFKTYREALSCHKETSGTIHEVTEP